MVHVNANYCPQNHPCPMVRRCPSGALQQRGYAAPYVLGDECIECGNCAAFCRVFELDDSV